MGPGVPRKQTVHYEEERLFDEEHVSVVGNQRPIPAALPWAVEATAGVLDVARSVEQRPQVFLSQPRCRSLAFAILPSAVDENDTVPFRARRIDINRAHDVRIAARVDHEVRPESVELVGELVFVGEPAHWPDVEKKVGRRRPPSVSERDVAREPMLTG